MEHFKKELERQNSSIFPHSVLKSCFFKKRVKWNSDFFFLPVVYLNVRFKNRGGGSVTYITLHLYALKPES